MRTRLPRRRRTASSPKQANKREADRYAKALRPILNELCHMPVNKIADEWRGNGFYDCDSRWFKQIKQGNWCCQTGLNCRPLHYQWSALPLSYGSMPRIRESANRPRQGGPILATRPEGAQARERPARPSKVAIIIPECRRMPSIGSIAGRSGSPFLRPAPPAP